MPEPVPYTFVIDGQRRQAQRRIEAGEAQPLQLTVIGETDSNTFNVPLLSTELERERWFYDFGRRQATMRPRATCLTYDEPGEASLFGSLRNIVISYFDANGLMRSVRVPYGKDEAGAFEWRSPDPRSEFEPGYKSDQAALRQFWAGCRITRAMAAEQIQRQREQRGRGPTWRFRK